ncbi:tyrosine-type recombinase/integrase [Streptomyces sp. NPDC090231]|uniref:tyrosine-type recombinase/integrase n=1 Tax=unclassified Streptomyces TaxID=2593676 RepID=UPI003819960F
MSVPIKKLSPDAKGKVRYRFVVDVGAHSSTGKRRQVTRTFGTLREAKAEYAHITHRRYEAAAVPFDVRTLDEWLDEWLGRKAEDLVMGLRPAEICGMRWSDVDLGGAILTVHRTRTLTGNKVVVEKDTKSLAGERELPLPDLVGEELTNFKAAQVTEKLDAGERYEDNGYVLVDGLGMALNGRQLRERAYRVMAENSLRRVRFVRRPRELLHVPREQGVPDHLLARRVGHTDVRTAKRRYAKPDVEDLRPGPDMWGELASAPAPVHGAHPRCGSVSG